MRKVTAKISLKNINDNAKAFKAYTGKRLCAVVKADAYGHGAEEVAAALSGVADCFAVSLLDEATAIRAAACGKDILIFTPPLCETDVASAAENGYILTVPDLWTARLVARVCERRNLTARVHLKVNTGMNRYGMNGSMLGKTCKFLRGNKRVRVEGLYSHLYEYRVQPCNAQRALFVRFQTIFRRYFPSGICHLSATYGSLLGEEFAFDMTRVGIGLYGYFPDGAQDISLLVKSEVTLKKAMRVETLVSANRVYAFGGAGYGAKPQLEKGTKLCVCRYGYADGFLRKKENGADGYAQGANNLCMDASIRLGTQKRGKTVCVLTDALQTARIADTISYEVLCAATRRAERIYIWEDFPQK